MTTVGKLACNIKLVKFHFCNILETQLEEASTHKSANPTPAMSLWLLSWP